MTALQRHIEGHADNRGLASIGAWGFSRCGHFLGANEYLQKHGELP